MPIAKQCCGCMALPEGRARLTSHMPCSSSVRDEYGDSSRSGGRSSAAEAASSATMSAAAVAVKSGSSNGR